MPNNECKLASSFKYLRIEVQQYTPCTAGAGCVFIDKTWDSLYVTLSKMRLLWCSAVAIAADSKNLPPAVHHRLSN